MKYVNILISSIFFLILLSLSPNVFAANSPIPSAQFLDDEIIVKLKPSAPSSDIHPLAQAISGEIAKELLLKDTFVLKVPKGSVEKVIKTLSDMPQVATATPNYTAQKQSVTNDPSLQKEWGLFQIQAASSSSISAWDKTAGKPDIKVAVLDTGIEKTHPDLQGKVVAEKNFTSSSETGDRDGHGTHVAGIIAATGNNSSGIAGVSYDTSLINVKVLNDDGSGTYADIADGIVWAADNGAKVINLSLGGHADLQLLQDAVDYAHNKGAVLVAAAGNSGTNNVMYPANYSNVLSVAATDDSDSRLSLSNYGSAVKVAAPGDKIYSTYRNNSYSYASGTSMAAAFASGVAALVWSSDTCSTNTCVLNRIETTSDAVAETGTYWKFGRINALKAVSDTAQDSAPGPTNSPTPLPSLTPTVQLPPPPPVNSEPTVTPTPTVKQNSITASNIEMWITGRFTRKNIFIRVSVIKQPDSNKVAGAAVTIDLTTPDGTVYTGSSSTNFQGQVTFALRGVKDVGVYKTEITDVILSSYIYTPTKTKSQLTIN